MDLSYQHSQHVPIGEDGYLQVECNPQSENIPVIFVNNFYIVGPIWRNFVGSVAESTTPIYYDLRNQGQSVAPTGVNTKFEDHVEDIKRILDHLEYKKAIVVGSSVSTLIVKEFARAYPEYCSGLVLVGPGFSPNGELRRQLISTSWLTALRTGGTEALFDNIYPIVFGDHSVHAGEMPQYLGLKATFVSALTSESIDINLSSAMEASDDISHLSKGDIPVHIIVGDGDFAWSSSVVEDFKRSVPNATVDVLAQAGHVPFFDAPQEFVESFQRFVRAVA